MKSQKVKTFSDEERIAIVQEYLNLGPWQSKRCIMYKYGITGHSTLRRWLDRYVKDGRIVAAPPEDVCERQMKLERKKLKEDPKEPRAKSVSPTKSEVEKDKEILKLRLELERERTRVLALNRMIDIAESELNISIRKKSGAKQ